MVDLINELVAKKIAPGAVMLIEQKGKTVFMHSAGHASVEAGRSMNADTLVRIFSMTKPMTSLAAMKLVEEGQIKLDDPIANYLPEFAHTKVWDSESVGLATKELARPITVADLLRHTAGFTYQSKHHGPIQRQYFEKGVPASPSIEPTSPEGTESAASSAELAVRIASIPLLNQPGERFTYGNATDVLGRLVEVVYGKSLGAVFEEEIYTPLNMTDTSFQFPVGEEARFSTGYFSQPQLPPSASFLGQHQVEKLGEGKLAPLDPASNSIFAKDQPIEFGGAGLISTAKDYLKFTSAMRAAATGEDTGLIGQDLVALMRTNQLGKEAISASPSFDGLGFGFGFAVRTAPTTTSPTFPQCGFFWGGAASTFFWIDPQGQTSGVMMTQVIGGDVRQYYLALLEALYSDQQPD